MAFCIWMSKDLCRASRVAMQKRVGCVGSGGHCSCINFGDPKTKDGVFKAKYFLGSDSEKRLEF